MKRLIVEIGVLILLLAVVLTGLEYLYTDYVRMDEGAYVNLEKKLDKVTQLNVGNSHMGVIDTCRINDKQVSHALSFIGIDLFHMMASLEAYIPQMPALNYVVVGVDDEMLGYNWEIANQLHRDKVLYKYTHQLYDDSWMNRLLVQSNFYLSDRDMSYLVTAFLPKASSSTSSTPTYIPLSASGWTDKGCKKRATEMSVIWFSKDVIHENLGYLERIVAVCKKYHITLIVLNPPKSPCFNAYYNAQTKALTQPIWVDFCQKNRLPYIQLNASPWFNQSHFEDYDHLNASGVAQISRIFDTLSINTSH